MDLAKYDGKHVRVKGCRPARSACAAAVRIDISCKNRSACKNRPGRVTTTSVPVVSSPVHYSTIAELLREELCGTDAWRKYDERVAAVFSRYLEASERDK